VADSAQVRDSMRFARDRSPAIRTWGCVR
jgi:hypothetical protein